MLRNIILLFFIICGLASSVSFAQKNTVHIVSSGETFYAICRKYTVASADVLKANPGLNIDKLSLGQKINIPGAKVAATSTSKPTPVTNASKTQTTTTTATATTPAKQNGSTHTVQKGETGYAIAKLYGLSFADLKTLNGLTSDNIQVGQVLVVSKTATSVKPAPSSPPVASTIKSSQPLTTTTNKTEITSIKSVYNSASTTTESEDPTDPTVNRTDVRTANNIRSNTQDVPTTASEAYQISANQNLPLQEQFQSYLSNDQLNRKIIKGVANYLTENSESANYIALFSGCPVGTVLKVRNLMNNKSVYVKVVGKLPESDASKDISVKISGSAAKALGALDEKFLAEVTSFVARN